MKKALSILICLLLCVQLVGAELLSAEAEGVTLLFEDSFTYASFDSMTGSGVWGLETVRKTDAKAPVLENGALVVSERSSVKFDWTKVEGVGDYDSAKTYIFSFDLTLTDKGDGSNWGGEVHTRGIYVAFGGWYNLIEMPTRENIVKLGGTTETYSDGKYLNKRMHATVIWEGTELSISLTDESGKELISGKRSSGDFVNMTIQQAAMTNLVLRCEDGAFEVDNFTFSVKEVPMLDRKEVILQDGEMAVYSCGIDYTGEGKTSVKFGGAELFSVEGTALSVAGKTVPGSYDKGLYTVNVCISPEQEMVAVEVILPDGGMVRRGFYTLLGGDAVCIFATGESKVTFAELDETEAAINAYSYTEAEPQYSGVGAKIYNIVTSFDMAQTTRNLAWTVNASFQAGRDVALQYRKAGETEWLTADGIQEQESTNTLDENYFKCDLTDLQADTCYEYRIGIKDSKDEAGEWTEIYSFTTAPQEISEFSFIAVGDTQGITWNGKTTSDKGFMYAMSAYQEAFEELSNPAFIVHVGDVVETGNNKKMWNLYFKTLGDKGTSVPMFAAIGNHDTWGGPVYFDLHFNHPNNGGTAALDATYLNSLTDGNLRRIFQTADETIYSYDYGNAHFIVLNTGSYCGEDQYLIEAQREWLIADLESHRDAKWTVMMFHQPIYHRMGEGQSRPWLSDVIEGYGVDLVIQGHSHLVTRTYPMKDGQIVTKENLDVIPKGTGTVYTTIGSTALNHDGAGDSTYEEEMAVLLTPTPTQSAYTIVTVKGDSLVVTTKQINGFVLDQFTLLAETEKVPDTDTSREESVSGEESEESFPSESNFSENNVIPEEKDGGDGLWIAVLAAGVLVVGAALLLLLKRKKK